MSDSHGSSFVAGMFFGMFVGAALALMFAPAPGDELRGQLRDKGIELKTRAEEVDLDDLKNKGHSLLREQKIRFQEAIEEGKQAAYQKKEDLLAQLESRAPAEPTADEIEI